MAKIFVSSTYLDLKDFRERVSSVIRKMDHTDVAMEYFVAEDKRPLDKCLADVVACDLYIGIFAWRYGYIPSGYENSITELEYRKARESGKPCLIFLLKDSAPWRMSLVEKEKLSRIEALRKELSNNHLPALFSSIDELGECVAEAIHRWDKDRSVPLTPQNVQGLNLVAYHNAVLKQYKILDLDALTPPEKADFIEIQLRSIFVEQDVRENPPPIEIPKELLEKLIKDEKLKKEDLPEGIKLEDIQKAKEAYLKKPMSPVLDIITNPKNHYVVILGDPGSGKSTLSRYIVLSLITKEDEKLQKVFENYIPLLIELRDYAAECTRNKCNTFVEYLDLLGRTKGYGLTKETLDNYLKKDDKAILIFDGLDEIFDPNLRESIEKQIVGFTIDYPKVRIIVTSRIVGYKRRILTNADFSHYTLQDFRKPQMEAFIDRWYGIALINNPEEACARKERINHSLNESASIRQLAGNPLLLTIMAIINKHQELPRERWRLYEHASSVLIHHWDWERSIKEWNIQIDYVSKDDKEELLRRIAYKMQSAPLGFAGNFIHADTLQEEFEKYFMERYRKDPADAKLASQVLIEQLRERNFILCRYGSNLYGFIHRTFLEYFCAWSIVWKFNRKHEFDIEDIKNIFKDHWGDKSWHEVLRLICGMIDEKFAEILIRYLMSEPPPSPVDLVIATINRYKEIFVSFDYLNWLYEVRNSTFYRERFDTMWKYSHLMLAIKCMGELNNIEIIRDTSSELLEKIWEMLVEGHLWEIEQEDFIASIKPVGKRWAGRESLKDKIPAYAKYLKYSKFGFERFFYLPQSNYVGIFIGCVGAGDMDIRKQVELLLKDNVVSSKNIALTALAFGWHDDPVTLRLLKMHALKDSDETVRKVAISLIGQGWWHGDTETLEMLQNCSLTDPSDIVRKSAIEVISEHLSNNTNNFTSLSELAKSAKEFKIRQFATLQVGKIWEKDINALKLLKDRALNDTYYGVREIAISLLYELWRDDPTVLGMLYERVSREPNPVVRNIIYKFTTGKITE